MSDMAQVVTPITGSRRRLPLLILAVALLAAAGAAAWWLKAGPATDDEAATASTQARIFVPLEQFTVNLADEGGERIAQIAVTLEVADDRHEIAIKRQMPAIRNTILLLLSSRKSQDLLTTTGKQQLAGQIAEAIGIELGWQPVADADPAAADRAARPRRAAPTQARPNPVAAVLFSHFIIQ